MNTNTLTLLLQVAGLLHLGLLCAGLWMPKVVGLREHLATLPGFIRTWTKRAGSGHPLSPMTTENRVAIS